MHGSHTIARMVRRTAWAVALTAALMFSVSAYAATPTEPTAPEPIVSGVGKVTISWTASRDVDGHAITYDVYRYHAPITATNLGSATRVAQDVAGTSVTVDAHADEIKQSYVWFYAVRAKDSGGLLSIISKTASPNLHGYRTLSAVYSCLRCHSIHGAAPIDYTTVDLCYYCHGTEGESVVAIGARSSINVKAQFFDYAEQEAGSKHRSDKMTAGKTECDACHTPHRSPYFYTNAGAYDAAQSFPRMLRVQTGVDGTGKPTYTYYSQASSPQGNGFCLACHGPNATPISYVGDPNAFAATAGDHTYAAGAAHSTTNVFANKDPRTLNPNVQCLACHNKHASATTKLIDYRGSGTADPAANAQAELCYKCHSAAGYAAEIAAGTSAGNVNFAWNTRDVKAQFGKASKHPTAAGSGRWTPTSGEVFSQTTQAEFAANTLSQTVANTADGDGSVVLGQETIVTAIPPNPYVLSTQAANDTAAGGTRSYLVGDASWNQRFNPTDVGTNPGAGANSATKNNVVFAMQGGNTTTYRTYTPPANSGTGTWGTTTALWGNAAAGSDSAFDSTHDFIWALATGVTPSATTTNIRRTTNFAGTALAWNNPGGSGGPAFRVGGTYVTLGAGAALAWAPAGGTSRPERLYVVNKNGTSATSNNGLLYYYNDPDNATGGTNWTSTTHQVGSTAPTDNTGSRMVYFRIGTNDYLYYLRGQANAQYLIQLPATDVAAGTVLINGTANPWNGTVGDGCSLVWNGDTTQAGFRLYATRGGNAGNSFMIGTWNGTTLVWNAGPALLANSTTGTFLSQAVCDPADPSTVQYYASGTVLTGDITIPSTRPTAWGTVTFTKTQPANTNLTVTVQGYNGTAWVDLVTSATSPIDVSGFSATTYKKLRLRGNLSTTAPLTATPRLDAWAVTASWDTFETGSYLPEPEVAFSQPAPSAFGAANNTFLDTVVNANAVVLDTYTDVVPIPAGPYVLVSQAANNGRVDSYGDGHTIWNRDWTPTNIGTNPGAGASSATKNGRVFAFQGGASNVMRVFTPPANSGTGTWATTTNVWGNTGGGSDLVSDSSHDYLWALATGVTPSMTATNIRRTTNFAGTTLAWNNPGGSGGPAFRVGGTYTTLGVGATLAWVPANGTRPERLYVVNRNGTTTRDGLLYYYNDPDNATGWTSWTSTTHVLGRTTTTADTGSRMAYFRIGTTDYLYYLRGAANNQFLIQLANTTASAGTVLINGTANPWNGNIGDGCSLVWNGDTTQAGFRLYATRGGNAGTSFKVATWNGSTLVWSDGPALQANSTTGTYLSYVTADPADPTMATYHPSGTVTTRDITPMPGSVAWGSAEWNATLPAGTEVRVTAQGWNGSTWVDLASGSTSPLGLTDFSTTEYTKLRLVGTLTTANPASATPRLDGWTANSAKLTWKPSGSVTCANCHNVHSVGTGGSEVWDMARVSDPDNTKLAFTGTPTQFCLRCHDGSAPAAVTNETALVPYAVGFRAFDVAEAPFFGGWNKQAAGADWASSGHASSRVTRISVGCDNCHDPHGSNNPRLLAGTAYYVGASPPGSHVNLRRNDAATYAEEGLCYVCHTSQRGAPNCTGGSCHPNIDTVPGLGMNVQTAFTGTYRHPVEFTGRHSDTEGPAELGQANRHAECADCHDPHATRPGKAVQGSSQAGNVLIGATGIKPSYATPAYPSSGWEATNWTAAQGYEPIRLTGQSTDFEAYLCLKCHSSYSGQPFQVTSGSGTYTSTDIALEFNPSNFSSHNVFGQSVSMKTAFTVGGTSYTWSKPTDASFLQAGWTSNSMMTCTSCHSNTTAAAKGPHGSTARWLIDPAYPTGWNTTGANLNSTTLGMPTTLICAKCHTNNRDANSVHRDHDDRGSEGGYCRFCHVGVPHGWKRPRLIAYVSDPAPYAAWQTSSGPGVGNYGTTRISVKNYTPSNWDKDDCGAGCSTGRHPLSGSVWP